MTFKSLVTIDGKKIPVEWESYTDILEPEGTRIFEGTIRSCPDWALKKYGEGVIIFACRVEEEEKAEERKTERRIE